MSGRLHDPKDSPPEELLTSIWQESGGPQTIWDAVVLINKQVPYNGREI